MKRLAFPSLLALAVVGFVACSDDEPSAGEPTADAGASSGASPSSSGSSAPSSSGSGESSSGQISSSSGGELATDSLSGFLQRHGAERQTFELDPAAGGSFVGAGGTELQFPPGAFAGDDPVRIRLREVLSRKHLALSGQQTESEGDLLVSGGQFLVEAERDGSPIELDEGKSFEVRFAGIPEHDATGMQLFELRDNEDFGLPTWAQISVQGVRIVEGFYVLNRTNLNWVNIDRFMSIPGDKTDLEVDLKNPGQYSNAQVIVVFRDDATTFGLGHNAANLVRFTSNYGPYGNLLPVGAAVKVLAMAEDSMGALHMKLHETTLVEAGPVLELDLPVVSEAEADALIDSL